MESTRNTEDQILSAFLRLAAERGVDGVTTREVATAAGVNPVTLFRRFGDKQSMALEAIRRFSPAPALREREPGVEPARALQGLTSCLLFLAELMQQQTGWSRLCWLQMTTDPAVREEMEAVPQAAYAYLRRALEQAGPALRPEVDPHAAALQWMGLLLISRTMTAGGCTAEPVPAEQLRPLFEAAIRPLLYPTQMQS